MATKFKLIGEAQSVALQTSTQNQLIQENLAYFASKDNITAVKLAESITHVLAGLSQTAKNMNPNSVAALLAGVEKLAGALASAPDSDKKQNTLKVLAAAAMNHDSLTNKSLPNQAVVSIAQYGAKFPEVVQKYARIVGAQDPKQLNAAARKLLPAIERAMNVAAQPAQSPEQSGQATVATAPASAAGATKTNQI